MDPFEHIVAPTRKPDTKRYRDVLHPFSDVAENVLAENIGCCPETVNPTHTRGGVTNQFHRHRVPRLHIPLRCMLKY
eukprot:983824-Pyramimonas_sp.AAC.1